MRVISGTCRGRKLTAPVGVTTRPTSDRVKEALFNILESRLDFTDLQVLDICAGTGSLGIEALSRGARSCCFIENNPSVKVILEKNLLVTRCQDRSEVILMDAVKGLQLLAGRNRRFNLVFFDPPYESGLYQRIFETVDSTALLAPESILVAECSARIRLPETFGTLRCVDRRVYGETAIELFTQGG